MIVARMLVESFSSISTSFLCTDSTVLVLAKTRIICKLKNKGNQNWLEWWPENSRCLFQNLKCSWRYATCYWAKTPILWLQWPADHNTWLLTLASLQYVFLYSDLSSLSNNVMISITITLWVPDTRFFLMSSL